MIFAFYLQLLGKETRKLGTLSRICDVFADFTPPLVRQNLTHFDRVNNYKVAQTVSTIWRECLTTRMNSTTLFNKTTKFCYQIK